MAQAQGVSKSTISTIWPQLEAAPCQELQAGDPQFLEKPHRYGHLDPQTKPWCCACWDKKPRSKLERTQPGLPMKVAWAR